MSIALVRGWVRSVRTHGKKGPAFVTISDGGSSQDVQVTLVPPDGQDTSSYQQLNKVGVGACVSARGSWVSRCDGQRELEVRQVDDWQVVGPCDLSSYPLQKKQHTAEYLRTELLHLRPRTRRFAATTRIRSHLSHQLNSLLQDRGYLHIHTPLLTSADCEGAGELFRVAAPTDFAPLPPPADAEQAAATTVKISDRMLLPPKKGFFKQPTFLSVSGQLHLETFASAAPGVYAFGPIFRADPSNTSSHLSEFWMLEPELSFAELSDAIDLCEQLVQSAVRSVVEHPQRSEDLKTVFSSLESSENDSSANDTESSGPTSLAQAEQRVQKTLQPFARMTYTEAVTRLGLPWGADLERKHEKFLCEEYCGGSPLFLTDYPAAIKPFYMRANTCDAPDRQTVACMDLLLPGLGEVAGGSAREERYDVLQPRINSNEQLKKQLGWYLDLRRYGSFPHAGFGIGFDRLVQFVTQTANIRDVIPFPRSRGRCDL